MTSSVVTTLTISNGQQWEDISVLQSDNAELKAKNNTMNDEVKQLTSLLGKMTVNNESQKEKIDSQSSTIEIIQDENKQLKQNCSSQKWKYNS